MSQTSTGTRDEPQFGSSGNAPTFPEDLSLLSTFFAARSLRLFATIADMSASDGSGDGEHAAAATHPQALYVFNGSSGKWNLSNQPLVAGSSDRDGLFSGNVVAVEGNQVYRSDLHWLEQYNGSAWVPTVDRVEMTSSTTQTIATGASNRTAVTFANDIVDTGAFTYSAGSFTCVRAGWYRLTATAEFAAASGGNRYMVLSKALAATPTVFADLGPQLQWTPAVATNPSGNSLFWCDSFAVGDILRLAAAHSQGSNLNLTHAAIEILKVA